MLITLLAACQPGGVFAEAVCPAALPADGEVRASPILCDAQYVPDGEGRGSDAELASAWLRATVRDPGSSLTLIGLDGGTVVDLSTPAGNDLVHEIVPVVGGGWLAVDTYEIGDGITVGGTVVSFPWQSAAAEGERREVTWRADPDRPALTAEGAEGLYVHARGDAQWLDGRLWTRDAILAPEGGTAEDLGGAVIFRDTDTLVVASQADAWALPGDVRRIVGTAPDAERLEWRDGDTVVGWTVLDGAEFDATIPLNVDGVRAVADGRTPSPIDPPGTSMALTLGAAGALDLRFAFEADPRLVVVHWSDRQLRSGSTVVSPDGGVLELGAGTYDLAFEAGPQAMAGPLTVEIPADGTAVLSVDLRSAFDPGERVLFSLPWPTDGDRRYRTSDTTAARSALQAGVAMFIAAPIDNVAAYATPYPPYLRANSGSWLVSEEGWSIVAWPWSQSSRRNAHGAVDPADLDAENALLAVALGQARSTAVDLPWLAAAPITRIDPRPGFAVLTDPLDDPIGAWSALWPWLDAGVPLVPIGPRSWVSVPDRASYNEVDVEDGLFRGHVVAGDGPLLDARLDGLQPGDPVPEGIAPRSLRVTPHGGLDRVVLIIDGVVVMDRPAIDESELHFSIRTGGRYLMVVGMGPGGWSATAPFWLDPPG